MHYKFVSPGEYTRVFIEIDLPEAALWNSTYLSDQGFSNFGIGDTMWVRREAGPEWDALVTEVKAALESNGAIVEGD